MNQAIYCEPCRQMVMVALDEERKAQCPDCEYIISPPDVFISYSTPDYSRAKELAEVFRKEKLTPWLAPDDRVTLGNWVVTAVANALVEAKVLVLVLSSSSIESVWVRREVERAAARNLAILPLMIKKCSVDEEFKLLIGPHNWLPCLEESFAAQIDAIVKRVRYEVRARRLDKSSVVSVYTHTLDTEPLLGVTENDMPYVGPTPYPRTWGAGFYGRNSEAEGLLSLIGAARIVLLYAPSGAGKSSLLNAEIAPSLEAANYDVLPGRGSTGVRVGGEVSKDLMIGEDLRNIFAYSAISGLEPGVKPSPTRRLIDCLRAIGRGKKWRRIVIFDQFEELFTQHSERHKDRGGFINQVVEALRADPTLHVLFAIRKEFLSDMLDLAKGHLPQDFSLQMFPLPRMGEKGALEAITQPMKKYATFAPGVAEEIVTQLCTIRVPGPEKQLQSRPGEYIEMVHLQIVCKRLWDHLAHHQPGVSVIEQNHLENFCGKERSLGEFVPNALNSFYEDVINDVSRTTKVDKRAIQFGLMKFVTVSSTRTIVQQTEEKTGRLSNRIIESLEKKHLLRFEKRGEQRWYELSHDSLADPVSKQRELDPELSKLLFAADLLDKILEKAKAESLGTLNDYFGKHHEILAECKRFQSQVHSLLEEEELEFLFRASLRSKQDQCEWSQQLKNHFPDSHMRVLKNAISHQSAQAPKVAREIRENVAVLLGQIGERAEAELLSILVRVAIQDDDVAVRQAAALSLARLDREDLYNEVINALNQAETRVGGIEALTRIRIAVDSATSRSQFENIFTIIPPQYKKKIQSNARRNRFKERFPAFPAAFVMSASFAAISAGCYKWVPGMAGWSVTQATPNGFMGAFQGVTAGVIWAGLITLGLTYFHVVYEREQDPKSILHPAGALLAGALSGLFASAVVVFVVLVLFVPGELVGMGWITSGMDKQLVRSGYFHVSFMETKFAWVDLITGTGLGIGMGMMTNAIRSSDAWNKFFAERHTIGSFTEARQVTWKIMKIAVTKVWILFAVLGVAASLAVWVPDTQEYVTYAFMTRANFTSLVEGLIGDCSTQAVGAYFGIVGTLLATFALRHGIHIEPRKDRM